MAFMYDVNIQNSECKSLDDLTISVVKDGVKKQIPALNSHWAQSRCYMHYSPPPSAGPDGSFPLGARDNWLNHLDCFCEDLNWFLHLEQFRFWSQMVYDKQALEMILSFLQEAPPYYIIHEFPQDDMWEMFKKAHRLVFMVVTRLVTCRESKREFMTPQLLAQLIYDNYIFTVPVLLDLCLLYGRENRAQLVSIISKVFKVQPQYTEDLVKAVPFFVQVLQCVEHRLQARPTLEGFPGLLTERCERPTLTALHDLILHSLDTIMNLSAFLDVYTPACSIFHQQNFEPKLVVYYEYTIPEMYRQLEVLANKVDNQEQYMDLKNKLNMTRVELLKAFRLILSSCINNALENKERKSAEDLKRCVDEYLVVLTDSLAEKLFMRDYYTAYQFGPDLDMLEQLCPEIDTEKREFLLEAALSCFDVPSERPKKKHIFSENGAHCSTFNDAQPEKNGGNECRKPQISGVHLNSLITEVNDILPHLGDGFIQACLEEFDYVSERVVNAVLENQLPAHLDSLERTLSRVSPEPPLENELINGIQRLNVFDNDEFDIMTQDHIDTSRVHRGKRKDKFQNVCQLIDDKSHRNELRDAYTRFGILDTEGSMYDDEYDDTYDNLDVSVGDEGDLDRRPTVVPRVLQQRKESESSGAESTAEEEVSPSIQQDHFVANPEELRQQAERKRQMRQFPNRQPKDVVGRPKGQGQDKQVTANRNNKSVHKSSRGNHNRRTGAQRKRQQGMMPI